MASGQHIYDLTLLLDPAVEAERREQIVADVADLIDRTGEFIGRHDWGTRQTAYEVRKKAEADYHLIQFRGENELLEQLDHNLKITDGVLRHRIIKLRPGHARSAGPAPVGDVAGAAAEPAPAEPAQPGPPRGVLWRARMRWTASDAVERGTRPPACVAPRPADAGDPR